MVTKFSHVRLGHPFGHINHGKRDACGNSAFNVAPATGLVLSSTQPLNVKWDTSSTYQSCLGSGISNVDITLISATGGRLISFRPVPFSAGSKSITLNPSWWNSTSSVQLSVSISPDNGQPFFTPFAAGPFFTVNYNASVAGGASNGTDPGLKTTGGVAQSGGLPKGSIAAAVLLPIIAVILAIAIYIKISRKKREEKRKRWSQAMDARMSRISGDWKTMTPKGAQAAFRDSSATGGMRMSTVFASEMQMDIRPESQRISIAQSRPSGETVGTRTSRFNPYGERTSRISFAADTNASKERLSMYSGVARSSTYSTSRVSRAFHVGDAPPVPRPPISLYTADGTTGHEIGQDSDIEEDNHVLSPTQTQGPLALSNDDINNLDIAPALHMMRASNNPALQSSEDLLLAPPTPLTPIHPPPSPLGTSPNAPPLSPLGMMPMQPQGFSLSPDDLLRQYATARAIGPAVTISAPAPVYTPATPAPAPVLSPTTTGIPQYTASGMRNLTGDASLNSSAPSISLTSPHGVETNTLSVVSAASQYDDDDEDGYDQHHAI